MFADKKRPGPAGLHEGGRDPPMVIINSLPECLIPQVGQRFHFLLLQPRRVKKVRDLVAHSLCEKTTEISKMGYCSCCCCKGENDEPSRDAKFTLCRTQDNMKYFQARVLRKKHKPKKKRNNGLLEEKKLVGRGKEIRKGKEDRNTDTSTEEMTD